MSLGKGGSDHPCSEGGSWEEGGGDEAGGGDEEGEEGSVDGVFVRVRLGKKGQLPYSGLIEALIESHSICKSAVFSPV